MNYINPNNYGGLLFDEKEENAVKRVLKEDTIFRYGEDKISKVDEFEIALKKLVNSKYALGVTNGTSGLVTGLIACDVHENDRVLVSSFTFLATALAVKMVNAIPIPIEIDNITGFDLEDLEAELKRGAKAVIVVHFQGRCFNLNKVKQLTKKYQAYLIEDSCQGFGANNGVKYAGTIGDIGVYSFQQFKQITCGEGGAIVTNNKKLYNICRNYTDMGSERNLYPNWDGRDVIFGQNYRMNNISGAILCEQLKKLDFIIKSQRESRSYILNNINSKRVINSYYPDGDTGMNILLLLDSKDHFDKVKNQGIENNIEVRRMWTGMYFDNKLFKHNKLTDKDLKTTRCDKTRDFISKLAVISIPPLLTREGCLKLINFINSI